MIPGEIIAKARDRAIVDVALALGANDGVKVDERGVPCPGCGGKDRFSVDKSKNVFLCRASGAGGDPIALVQHVHGVSFGDAIEQLTGEKPLTKSERVPAKTETQNGFYREKARHRAWKIWRDGAPIEPERHGHWVRDYLALRAIPFPSWRVKTLREASRLPYWHWSKRREEFVIVHQGPAMLAAITGPDGRFMGVHRTWLDLKRPNGKAAITDPETGDSLDAKKVEGSQRGGKIVLRDGEPGGACVLGEGIETTLSWNAPQIETDLAAFNGSGFPTAALWAGINIDNIAGKATEKISHPSLVLADSLGRKRRQKVGGHEPDLDDKDCLQIHFGLFDKLILLGDGDSDRFTTQAAMMRARNRFELTGHDAVIDWAPDGQDFNDVLRDASRRAPAALPPAAPAGRAIGRDGQSPLRPAAEEQAVA